MKIRAPEGMPAWVPYAVITIGAGVGLWLAYKALMKGKEILANVGTSISSSGIETFKPKGVYNEAPNVKIVAGKMTFTGMTPEYAAAVQGFIAANPQFTPETVVRILNFYAWNVGKPAPQGLNAPG